MIEGYGPVMQALLGTLFTWGLTFAGAALVLFVRGTQRKLLDVSLGFAAGVMIAASYWSLLAPAITSATESKYYGEKGEWAFLPVAGGFLIGAAFVHGADILLEYLGINSTNMMLAMTRPKNSKSSKNKVDDDCIENNRDNGEIISNTIPLSVITVQSEEEEGLSSFDDCINNLHHSSSRRRNTSKSSSNPRTSQVYENVNSDADKILEERKSQWKRIILLVVVITVHNIPEGLAVGVAFAAAATPSGSFQTARNLAIGIGIQNFPEGLAVSLPLQATGFSVWKSLWYGQLSGMVEPVFGVLGAVAVSYAEPILPYALSFAAGAMIYVVADDILPEANTSGNGKLASWGCIFGFIVMMCLEVCLG